MPDTDKPLSLFDRIIAYEQGDLPEEEIPQLFQALIDNGQAWSLQGHYGRTAIHLMLEGKCKATTPKATAYLEREKKLRDL